jgi:hypothetical protein
MGRSLLGSAIVKNSEFPAEPLDGRLGSEITEVDKGYAVIFSLERRGW